MSRTNFYTDFLHNIINNISNQGMFIWNNSRQTKNNPVRQLCDCSICVERHSLFGGGWSVPLRGQYFGGNPGSLLTQLFSARCLSCFETRDIFLVIKNKSCIILVIKMIYSTRYFQIKMPGYQRNTPPPVVGEEGGTVQVNH